MINLTGTGGNLTNTQSVYLGGDTGGSGTATVSSGTWSQIGNNKFVVGAAGTGVLTINGGLVSVGGTLSTGTAGTINLISGGTLQIGTGGAGGVLLGGSLANNGTLIFNRTNASTYSGVLSGAGAVVKQGAGTLTLSGSSSYSGGTTLTAGTLALRNTSALGTGNLAVNAGTLDLNGYSAAVGSLSGSSGGDITSSTTGALTLTTSSTANSTYAGSIQTGLGTVSLVKQGAGTLSLTGSNSYSGVTTVSAGELKVNGSTGTGAMTIASVATLSGTGTIGGAATISGTHMPGNSPGIQTFTSDLTYAQVGVTAPKVFWELVGNTTSNSPLAYDQINVGGNLDFGAGTGLTLSFGAAGSNVTWSNPFWSHWHQWTIYDVAGTTANADKLLLAASDWRDSSNVWLSAVRVGYTFQIIQIGNDVVIEFVPEPSTYSLAVVGLGLAGLRHLRKRRAGRSARLRAAA